MKISVQTARRLAVASQYLAGDLPEERPLLNVIRRLGCVQLDPINVVARSPLLVLWSRLGNYKTADLDHALWQEKSLFEYWAHAASIVLTENYPIHHIRMRQFASNKRKWATRAREWLAENGAFQEYVLTELKTHGPLLPTELEDRSQTPWTSGGWSAGRNVSMMLDLLWWQGKVMVADRTGIRKHWQVTELHLPHVLEAEQWPTDKIVYEATQIGLKALGVGRARDIKDHFIRGYYPELETALAQLQAERKVLEVEVGDFAGTWYIHRDTLPLLDEVQSDGLQPRTVLLSPFDNLICDRDRTELLFDFYYRSEIYTPKKKRQFGYYVMPILRGERLVGRIDPKLDRKKGILRVHGVFLEEGVAASAELAGELTQTVRELATFLGVTEVVYGEKKPKGWERVLEKA